MTQEIEPPPPGMRRRILTIEDTGETFSVLLDEHDNIQPDPKGLRKKQPTRYSSPYATIFTAGATLLARDRRIRGTEHRVLAAILATAPLAEVEFPTQVTKLADTALLGENQVARSLAILADVGIITRPRHGWLSLNPRYVWRGGAAGREEALEQKIASAQGAEEPRMQVHSIEDAE